MNKDIKEGDLVWLVEHSVYGDPNGPVNEPFVLSGYLDKQQEGGLYMIHGNGTYGIYFRTEDDIFKTKEEATEYIKEHRDEIIKKSFDNHKKYINRILKK